MKNNTSNDILEDAWGRVSLKIHLEATFLWHRVSSVFTFITYCDITLWCICINLHAHQQELTVPISPCSVLLNFKLLANLTDMKWYLTDVLTCLITFFIRWIFFSYVYWPFFYFLLGVVGQCFSNCQGVIAGIGLGGIRGTYTLAVFTILLPNLYHYVKSM